MRIALTSVMVDNQEKALAFYTNILGFEKKGRHPRRPIPLADGNLPGWPTRSRVNPRAPSVFPQPKLIKKPSSPQASSQQPS